MTLPTFPKQPAGSGLPYSGLPGSGLASSDRLGSGLLNRPEPPDAGKSDSGTIAKLVVFPIGTLTLALPMSGISRVINMPEVMGSGLGAVGVATLDHLQLTVVDLHRQLFKTPAPLPPGKSGYLVILPSPAGYPIGIPTATTPVLVDVPERDIRVLPPAYRQADTLSIASHITRISTDSGKPQSAFLLDVAAVISQISL